MSSVRELANDVCKLCVCARVQEICQRVRSLVSRRGVYNFFLRLNGVCGMPPPMWFVYLCVMFCVLLTTVVGFVVKVENELHREVVGSKAILALRGLPWGGASIGAIDVRGQVGRDSSWLSLMR